MRLLLTAVAIGFLLPAGWLSEQWEPAESSTRAPTATLGKILYDRHCAFCHGNDLKGGGPYSTSLKVWPPDLTTLAKKNHGTYPAMRVAESIDGEFRIPAHGSREMPMWGPVFRSLATGRRDSANVRIQSLVRYIESKQEK